MDQSDSVEFAILNEMAKSEKLSNGTVCKHAHSCSTVEVAVENLLEIFGKVSGFSRVSLC